MIGNVWKCMEMYGFLLSIFKTASYKSPPQKKILSVNVKMIILDILCCYIRDQKPKLLIYFPGVHIFLFHPQKYGHIICGGKTLLKGDEKGGENE